MYDINDKRVVVKKKVEYICDVLLTVFEPPSIIVFTKNENDCILYNYDLDIIFHFHGSSYESNVRDFKPSYFIVDADRNLCVGLKCKSDYQSLHRTIKADVFQNQVTVLETCATKNGSFVLKTATTYSLLSPCGTTSGYEINILYNMMEIDQDGSGILYTTRDFFLIVKHNKIHVFDYGRYLKEISLKTQELYNAFQTGFELAQSDKSGNTVIIYNQDAWMFIKLD